VIKVNGELHEVWVRPLDTLSSVLRESLLLTGTKESCGAGECGACSVLVDGRAVNSCLLLAVDMEGHDIITIEGLTPDDRLSPLQTAFVNHGAIHCGFCTPGMVVTATDYLENDPAQDRAGLKRAIEGNVCRCTGYSPILEAIESVQRARSSMTQNAPES
jgi:carbon-monoxide dehydrogenase small subunit